MTKKSKQELRQKIKHKRSQLDCLYIQNAQQQITQHMIACKEFKEATTIFCFVGTKDEIDTMPILGEVLRLKKRLVVPKCLEYGRMQAYQITALSQLEAGYQGIQEPIQTCKQIDKNEIDLAIVPCLTCNLEGQRLGYGGGFYDRYLQKRNYKTVVLCFEQLLETQIPVEGWDQTIDVVVTENAASISSFAARRSSKQRT